MIKFLGVGTQANAASGSITPTLPTGWKPGDVHICAVSTRDLASLAMSGWTKLVNAAGNASVGMTVFYRVAVAGDTSTAITGATGSIVAQIAGYRGCNNVSPIDQNGTPSANAAVATITAGAITTGIDNALLVFIGSVRGVITVSGYSGTPTPTERIDTQSGVMTVCLADSIIAARGTAVGARTATASVAGSNTGYLLSLKPSQTDFLEMF